MITIYHKSIKEKKLRKLDSFRTGSWVHVISPSEEEIGQVVDMLDIEDDLIKDALDPFEVPRLESEKGTTYVFTRVPQESGREIMVVTLLIVIGKNFVLTVAKEKLDFFDIFTRAQQKTNTTQKTKFFFELFAAINQRFNYFLLNISRQTHSLHAKIEKKRINNKDLVNFVDFERILNDFISVLVPTNTVLESLLSGRYFTLYEEDKDLIEDLFLASGQLAERAKAVLKYIVNIRNAYSNIMTYDLNRVMKILTALTIILTIPTMIFSFYGMNVNLPLGNSPHGALFISLATVFVSFGVFLLFVRNRWL